MTAHPHQIGAVALLVRDYDDAIAFFCTALGFDLVEDTALGATKRWVRVAPKGAGKTAILLAKAVGPSQEARIGDQGGGRVMFFLETRDFARDHAAMTAAGVHFREAVRDEPYGRVAVFDDLYGNPWDLIEPRSKDR